MPPAIRTAATAPGWSRPRSPQVPTGRRSSRAASRAWATTKTCADYTCEIGTDGFIDNGLLQGPGIVLVPSNAVSVKNIDDLLHEHAPYYDRQGNRIGFMEWGAKFEDKEYQHVARWEDGDLSVSTVWLGIDHGWRAGGPPIIFETMIFGGEHNQERTRYATEAEAIEGHNRTVADVQAGRQPWFL